MYKKEIVKFSISASIIYVVSIAIAVGITYPDPIGNWDALAVVAIDFYALIPLFNIISGIVLGIKSRGKYSIVASIIINCILSFLTFFIIMRVWGIFKEVSLEELIFLSLIMNFILVVGYGVGHFIKNLKNIDLK